MYDGSHSVIFGTRNTWTNWFLIPDTRPVFNPPSPKTSFLDIPGQDGSLDISELLSGYPTFHDREGTMDFIVDNGHQEWQKLYSEIMGFLHGKNMNARLTDDPLYYYQGHFWVNKWRSEPANSVISINYRVGPYKWAISESTVYDFTSTDTTSEVYVPAGTYGHAPVTPKFIITEAPLGITVSFENRALNIDETVQLSAGTHQPDGFVFYGGGIRLHFKGAGKVSIKIREGYL